MVIMIVPAAIAGFSETFEACVFAGIKTLNDGKCAESGSCRSSLLM